MRNTSLYLVREDDKGDFELRSIAVHMHLKITKGSYSRYFRNLQNGV